MAIGAKRNETRSWAPSHCGPILIHAAKKWGNDLSDLCNSHPFLTVLRTHQAWPFDLRGTPVPLGVLLGTVEIVDCVRITESNAPTGNERAFGDYAPGRFMWHTKNAVRFTKPIPFRGAQGIFEVPDSILQRVEVPQ